METRNTKNRESIKKKKKKGIVSGILIFLLVSGGIVLLSYQAVVNHLIVPVQLEKAYKVGLTSEEMESNLKELEQSKEKQVADKEGVVEDLFDFGSVQSLDIMDVNPVINKKHVIGGIYIPSVNVNMPIMYGSTDKNLRVASGTMKPEQVMGEGNYSLAGHNARNKSILFAPLKYMNEKDFMYVTDKNKVYKYELVEMKVVMPNRVDVIDDVEDKNLLTLVSCYADDGSDRLIVTGELVDEYDYTDAEQDIIKAFNDL